MELPARISLNSLIYFIENIYMIPLQKVAFKLDISASSRVNPESAG